MKDIHMIDFYSTLNPWYNIPLSLYQSVKYNFRQMRHLRQFTYTYVFHFLPKQYKHYSRQIYYVLSGQSPLYWKEKENEKDIASLFQLFVDRRPREMDKLGMGLKTWKKIILCHCCCMLGETEVAKDILFKNELDKTVSALQMNEINKWLLHCCNNNNLQFDYNPIQLRKIIQKHNINILKS
jgi:hypothetical protein